MSPSLVIALLCASLCIAQDTIVGDIDRGLSTHFNDWLNANGYGKYGFQRLDLVGGAYGGKASDQDVLQHKPIIFFHGNSDIAVGTEGLFTGFSKSIEYFLSQGYSKSELYITTWGPGDKEQSKNQVHSKEYLQYLRAFTEAVISYTGAAKIDVISHSMGVSLGRRVIKGGQVNAAALPFNLGPSLSNMVDTYIGIAGANWGLVNCYLAPFIPTCNVLNGFYPGYAIGPMGMSTYLTELNNNQIREGSHIYSLFSVMDDLISYGDIVYGRYTSVWPTVDAQKVYDFDINCHMKLRDDTASVQFNLVTKHTFTSIQEEEISSNFLA